MASPAVLVDTWASLYANSAALRSLVSFAHVGGLLGGGGCAIAADLATLRAFTNGDNERARQLHSLRAVHRAVIGGLAVVVASGLLLLLADLDAYLSAPAFWAKMALVVTLALNGGLLIRACGRAERADGAAWTVIRRAARVSLTLWFATTLLGAVLPNAL